jgi:gliding motility-associated-like protein
MNNIAHAQVNLTQGLMLHLPFNGNTQDTSGNGNHAINYGATLAADQSGNANSAYQFNGTTDYMIIPHASTLSPNSFTIAVKVKPLSFYNGLCYNNDIYTKGASCGYGNGDIGLAYTPTLNQNPSNYCFVPDPTHENYRVFASGQGAANSLPVINTTNAVPYINANQWDCVIGTYDAATKVVNTYVNGVLRYSYTNTNALGTNMEQVFLGKQNSPNYEYWMNAVLDDVRLYNRVVNQDERDALCSVCGSGAITFAGDDGVCIGDTASVTASGGVGYSWSNHSSIISGTNQATIVCVPSTTTTYTVLVTDANSCTSIKTKQIVVDTKPSLIIAKSNDIQCQFSAANLSASGAAKYSWKPTISLSDSAIFNPVATPFTTTTYTVIGKNGACSNTDSITVNVFNNSANKLVVPNAFSPNNDGNNDCLEIISNIDFYKFECFIYNRFGEQVFASKDPNFCWNGQYKNTYCDVGVYYYYLKIATECAESILKGDVMIIQ